MNALFENLQNQSANRNVKVPILSCFGDIAFAITGNFESFLEPSMAMLKQAGEVTADPVSHLAILFEL